MLKHSKVSHERLRTRCCTPSSRSHPGARIRNHMHQREKKLRAIKIVGGRLRRVARRHLTSITDTIDRLSLVPVFKAVTEAPVSSYLTKFVPTCKSLSRTPYLFYRAEETEDPDGKCRSHIAALLFAVNTRLMSSGTYIDTVDALLRKSNDERVHLSCGCLLSCSHLSMTVQRVATNWAKVERYISLFGRYDMEPSTRMLDWKRLEKGLEAVVEDFLKNSDLLYMQK
jgi:hypothetical protein